MRNPTSKYCIHVQIQKDVPHPLTNLGALKFLLHQKMSILFLYVYFFPLYSFRRINVECIQQIMLTGKFSYKNIKTWGFL